MGKYKIATHSELMQNYHPGGAVSPEGRFIALQTNSGASLLFSINTEHEFLITKEIDGGRHGWQSAPLSSEFVKNPNQPQTSGHVCKTFAASQSIHGAQAREGGKGDFIQLALVVNDGTDERHPRFDLYRREDRTGLGIAIRQGLTLTELLEMMKDIG